MWDKLDYPILKLFEEDWHPKFGILSQSEWLGLSGSLDWLGVDGKLEIKKEKQEHLGKLDSINQPKQYYYK